MPAENSGQKEMLLVLVGLLLLGAVATIMVCCCKKGADSQRKVEPCVESPKEDSCVAPEPPQLTPPLKPNVVVVPVNEEDQPKQSAAREPEMLLPEEPSKAGVPVVKEEPQPPVVEDDVLEVAKQNKIPPVVEKGPAKKDPPVVKQVEGAAEVPPVCILPTEVPAMPPKELTQLKEDIIPPSPELPPELSKETEILLEKLSVAFQAVCDIDWRTLDELFSYKTPPATVKLVVSCVLLLLGDIEYDQIDDWKPMKNTIGGLTHKDKNFKLHVLRANPASWEEECVVQVRKLSKDLNDKRVKRSSKVCMPLYMWTLSMLKFRDLLTKLPGDSQKEIIGAVDGMAKTFFTNVSLELVQQDSSGGKRKGSKGGRRKSRK